MQLSIKASSEKAEFNALSHTHTPTNTHTHPRASSSPVSTLHVMHQHLLQGEQMGTEMTSFVSLPLKGTLQPCCTWPQWLWLAVGWGRCSLLAGEVQFCPQEVAFPLSASSISLGPPEA